jgi:hypothetical protein
LVIKFIREKCGINPKLGKHVEEALMKVSEEDSAISHAPLTHSVVRTQHERSSNPKWIVYPCQWLYPDAVRYLQVSLEHTCLSSLVF